MKTLKFNELINLNAHDRKEMQDKYKEADNNRKVNSKVHKDSGHTKEV